MNIYIYIYMHIKSAERSRNPPYIPEGLGRVLLLLGHVLDFGSDEHGCARRGHAVAATRRTWVIGS